MHARVQISIGVCTNPLPISSALLVMLWTREPAAISLTWWGQTENQKNPKGASVADMEGETEKKTQVFGNGV